MSASGWPASLGLAIAVAAYAWWATGLRPFSTPSLAAVVPAGAVAMVVGWRRPPAHRRVWPLRDRGMVAWGVAVAGLGAWELAAYLQSPRSEHPTLSSLTNAALESHPARAGAFVAWLAVAAALARR